MHFHCGSRDGQKDAGHSILRVFFKYYSAYFSGILNCIVVWVHFALEGKSSPVTSISLFSVFMTVTAQRFISEALESVWSGKERLPILFSLVGILSSGFV